MELAGENRASGEKVVELYRRYGAPLYGFALGFLGDAADAEDAVQEAFLRLDLHLRAGGPAGAIRAWLYTVVANLCRDELRLRRRRAQIPVEPWVKRHEPSKALALRAVLRRLRHRDRALVLLRGGGLSHAEIGAALALREGSVGKLLSRALERFSLEYASQFGKEDG